MLGQLRNTRSSFWQRRNRWCWPHQQQANCNMFVCLFHWQWKLCSRGLPGSLRCFIARHGKPSLVMSDHGTNFVGAARELKELPEFLSLHKTQGVTSDFCSSQHNSNVHSRVCSAFGRLLSRVSRSIYVVLRAMSRLLCWPLVSQQQASNPSAWWWCGGIDSRTFLDRMSHRSSPWWCALLSYDASTLMPPVPESRPAFLIAVVDRVPCSPQAIYEMEHPNVRGSCYSERGWPCPYKLAPA